MKRPQQAASYFILSKTSVHFFFKIILNVIKKQNGKGNQAGAMSLKTHEIQDKKWNGFLASP